MHGVQGKIANSIQNPFGIESLMVVVESLLSDWRPATIGVPQGLVLGPPLFVIYINDIFDNVVNVIIKFVGNTKIGGE